MTGEKTKQLRQENSALRNEIRDLQDTVKQLTGKIGKLGAEAEPERNGDSPPVERKYEDTVRYLSDQFDELLSFKKRTLKELQDLQSRISAVSTKCEEISAAIEGLEDYSYKYNVKIVGLPSLGERESSDQTTKLCLGLFSALGAKDVSTWDIDIAHRVPARRDSNKPNAIVCKFTRRLAKDKVMAVRKNVHTLQACHLDLPEDVSLTNVSIFEHLSPRMQSLFYEAKKFKIDNGFQFCWTKNGSVFLRKSESSRIVKLARLEDLNGLATD